MALNLKNENFRNKNKIYIETKFYEDSFKFIAKRSSNFGVRNRFSKKFSENLVKTTDVIA